MVQAALLEEGTRCKAEVEEASCMLEEQGLQGQTVGSPCSSPQERKTEEGILSQEDETQDALSSQT